MSTNYCGGCGKSGATEQHQSWCHYANAAGVSLPPPPDRIAELEKRVEGLIRWRENMPNIGGLMIDVGNLRMGIAALEDWAKQVGPPFPEESDWHDRGEAITLHRSAPAFPWTVCHKGVPGTAIELCPSYEHRTAHFDAPASVAAAEEKDLSGSGPTAQASCSGSDRADDANLVARQDGPGLHQPADKQPDQSGPGERCGFVYSEGSVRCNVFQADHDKRGHFKAHAFVPPAPEPPAPTTPEPRRWTLHSMYAPNGLGPFVDRCRWPEHDYPQHWLNGEAEHWEVIDYAAVKDKLAQAEKDRATVVRLHRLLYEVDPDRVNRVVDVDTIYRALAAPANANANAKRDEEGKP